MIKKIILLITTAVIVSCSNKQIEKKEIIDINLSTKVQEDRIEEEVEIIPKEKKYTLNLLSDKLTIKPIENNLDGNKKYVVATSDIPLYNYIDLKDNRDLNTLTEFITLKTGEIIEITDTVSILNTIHTDYFTYKGNNNYFFRTSVNNTPCLIWGADIISDFKTTEDVLRTSRNYRNENNLTYPDYNGNHILTQKNIGDLETSHIAFQNIGETTLLKSYYNDSRIRDNVIFITTDLLIDALDNLYTDFISEYEKLVIKDKLLEFSEIILKLTERDLVKVESGKYSETLKKCRNFFLLEKLLLTDKIDDNLPIAVIDEYNLIKDGRKITSSPVLGNIHDYTYYGKHSKYLTAINWLINSNIDIRMILVLNNYIANDKKLEENWNFINRYEQFTRGESRDLDFSTTAGYWNEYFLTILPSWIEDDNNINTFVEENNLYGKTFRIIGRRENRNDVFLSTLSEKVDKRGADILSIIAAGGSKSALSLINQYISDEEFEREFNIEYEMYKEDIENLEPDSLYRMFFNLISGVTSFEQNRYFSFTDKGKWNQKNLITSHALYTIIQNSEYKIVEWEVSDRTTVQQTEITSNVQEYNRPIHYVEPNLDFFSNYSALINKFIEFFQPEEDVWANKFKILSQISGELYEIAALEVDNREISYKQNEYIAELPSLLKRIGTSTYNKKITGDHTFSIGNPQMIHIPLENRQGGKRIATGYIYSYSESTEESKEPFWMAADLK